MANKPPHLSQATWDRMQGTGSYAPTPYVAPERPQYVPEDIWNATPQAYRGLLANKFKQDALTPRRPTGRVPAPVVPPDPRRPTGRVPNQVAPPPVVPDPTGGYGGGTGGGGDVVNADPKSMQSPLVSALSMQPQAWRLGGMQAPVPQATPANYYGGYQPPQQQGGKNGFNAGAMSQAGEEIGSGLSSALQSGAPSYQPYSGGQQQQQGGKNGF